WRQPETDPGHQRRGRTPVEATSGGVASQPRRLQSGGVDPGRLWRPAGPHLLAEVARVLRPRTPLAQRQTGRDSGRVKIYLYFIGKPKDANINGLAEDFIQRAARYCPAEMRQIRPDRVDPWEKHPTARRILLDPAGKALDSQRFTDLIAKAELEARDLV